MFFTYKIYGIIINTQLNNLKKYSYKEIAENPKIIYMEICGKCSLFNFECLNKNCLALDLLFIHFRESEELSKYLEETLIFQ